MNKTKSKFERLVNSQVQTNVGQNIMTSAVFYN